MGLNHPPQPHPNDRALLRPLSMLGKPAHMTNGVSFMRRTEYIASDSNRAKPDSSSLFRSKSNTTPRKRKASEIERDDDPVRMLRGTYKGFDVAYPHDAYRGPDTQEKLRGDAVTKDDEDAWNNPVHPTKADAVPLDTYPILPDLEALPDSGGFFVIRFNTNPSARHDAYDKRIDVAVMEPKEPYAGATAHFAAQIAAMNKARTDNEEYNGPEPKPIEYDYHLYLPEEAESVEKIHRKFDTEDAERDDDSLYGTETQDGGKAFRYRHVRMYETYQQTVNTENRWGETVAVALHDGPEGGEEHEGRKTQKAAYLYPIVQRVMLRPKRRQYVGGMPVENEDGHADYVDVKAVDAREFEIEGRGSAQQLYSSTEPPQVNGENGTHDEMQQDAEGDAADE